MTFSPAPSSAPVRISAGWYRAKAQLTLVLWRASGDGFGRVKLWERIVPRGCRFRVRGADVLSGRDVWHTAEWAGDGIGYTREPQQ